MESTPQTPDATRTAGAPLSRFIGPLVWVAVLVALGWFFTEMILNEPLTGDGWYNADEVKNGVTWKHVMKQLSYLHENGNPRIGMVFTMLTYGSRTFHVIGTPFALLAMMVLMTAHALGRWPSWRSAQDAMLVLASAAFSFLAVPQPGHAFFYRPVTTNYIYTFALSLLFFLPHRFGLRLKTTWGAALSSALVFAFGLFVGKTNEHTGPAMIVVAAACAAYAWRQGSRRDFAFHLAASAGVLIGYLYLFFAPGQERRYGSLGRQSVAQTITERGMLGTAELLGEYAGYVGPLLLVLCALGICALLLTPGEALRSALERARWTVIGYVGVSVLVLGTTMAAPKNHYRLFIAPAALLAIAGIAALEGFAQSRWVTAIAATGSALVVFWTAAIFVPMYREIHADELKRNAIVRAADPKKIVVIPRTRYAKRNSYYYGDSLIADPRHRHRMASLFDVREIRMEPKEKPKKPAPPKKKKVVKRVEKAPASPVEIELLPDAATP